MKKFGYVPTTILLVEDNPADIELTQESFIDAKIIANLDVAGNGLEALEYLKEKLPDIILLDLNMPKMDGREFLKNVKNRPEYRHIPIVILTTSQAQKDIIESYDLQASAYLSKPVKYDDFIEMMKKFDQFFLTFVKLPKSGK